MKAIIERSKNRFYSYAGFAALVAALFLFISPRVQAGVIIAVDATTNDFLNDGNCELVEAIAAANNNVTIDNCIHDGSGGTDEIQFSNSITYPATITLTQLHVLEPLIITGPGADKLFLNANFQSRILDIAPGITAKISGISFVNGYAHGLVGGADAKGGAIHVGADSLEIDNCGFFFNKADGADGASPGQDGGTGFGGAIYGESSSEITIKNSYLSSNFSNGGNGADDPTQGGNGGHGYGAAIFSLGPLTLVNTTVSQNGSYGGDGGNGSTPGDAGSVSAVIDSRTTLSLTHATIYFNDAQSGSGPNGLRFGGGVYLEGSAQLKYSIIAGNTGPVSEPDIYVPFIATATSLGHNVIGITSLASATGDIFGTNQSPVDPLLNDLADNGGGTFTHSLKDGSPALDIDTNASCAVATDQRGISRPQGAGCDAGAFEREVQAPSYVCPHSQGFWKTNPNAWPVTLLMLGSQQYTQAELLVILKSTTKADASMILAKQLIAAKLNIAAGSDPAPINTQISQADTLLSGFIGKLPYQIKTKSAIGKQMLDLAAILEQYDLKQLTPNCQP